MSTSVSTTWEVNSVVTDALLSEFPPRAPGEEWSAEFYLSERGRAVPAVDRFLALRDFIEYSDRGDYGRGIEGEPWYRERLPPGAPIASLAVPIEPQTTDSKGVYEGVWAFVTGGEEPIRNGPPYRVVLNVAILADRGEFATRSDLETAYRSVGI